MTTDKILSSANEYIKKVAKLKQKKFRDEFRLFVTEGERSCRDAANSRFSIDRMILSESYYASNRCAFEEFNRIVTTDKIFMSLCNTKTPQGVMAVIKMPNKQEGLSEGRYIYCDCIQDPGNAGTIIRSADAFGFRGVIFSVGSVDAFSPKVIRAAMGSAFHIDIKASVDYEALKQAKQSGFFVTASALCGSSADIGNLTVSDRQIFVVGNEGNGVSDKVLMLSDEIVHIPMSGAAESLNVGVAASILMYEVAKHE